MTFSPLFRPLSSPLLLSFNPNLFCLFFSLRKYSDLYVICIHFLKFAAMMFGVYLSVSHLMQEAEIYKHRRSEENLHLPDDGDDKGRVWGNVRCSELGVGWGGASILSVSEDFCNPSLLPEGSEPASVKRCRLTVNISENPCC